MKPIFVAVLLLGVCYAQSVPVEVKRAIVASIKASDSPTADDPQGGHHEEGGIWGMTTANTLVVIPAKAGKSLLLCHGLVTIYPGDAADPKLDKNLATIIGEWHIHPSGTMENDTCDFIQEPSQEDLDAADEDVNIEIGARNKVVYFYNHKGVTREVKLKDFLAGQVQEIPMDSIDPSTDIFNQMFDSGVSLMQRLQDNAAMWSVYQHDQLNIRRTQNCA